jgi:hypothetical protein
MRGRLIAAMIAIGTLSGVAAALVAHSDAAIPRAGPPRAGNWREIAWPFPRDGWPAGRAFRCDAATCGEAVELYVRPKIGFCNCDSGVADDDEVDRVADLDLISPRFAPVEAGRVVHVAELAGRSRSYDLKMTDGSQRAAVGFALSRRCDLLVAVAQGSGRADNVQRAAADFLGSDNMARWMIAALNGG